MKKTLLTAILSIVMCLSLMAGATFALFTSESTVNIAITSGKVDVVASISSLQVIENEGNWRTVSGTSAEFSEEGGDTRTVEINGSNIVLTNIAAGDGVKFNIDIANNSTINVKYRTVISNDSTKDQGLFSVLDVKINEQDFVGYAASAWVELAPTTTPNSIPVEIVLPSAVSDEDFEDNSCEINVVVEAVQGNGVVSLPSNVTLEGFENNNSAVADANGNYYSTLQAAFNALATSSASNMSATENVIYLKPNAVITSAMAGGDHPEIKSDVTIYGNYATMTGFDLAVEYQNVFVNTDVIDIKIYDINQGAAVWGYKKSNAIINIEIENCQNMNRVYISDEEGDGTTNISLKNCSFNGMFNNYKNTSVYTTSPGTINVVDTTFDGYAIPINLNNKSTGTQNISLTGCTFINCGTEDVAIETNSTTYAAPVRVVATKEDTAVSNLTLTDCEFIFTAGKKAIDTNILTEDKRPNKDNKGTVNVVIDGMPYVFSKKEIETKLASSDSTVEFYLGEGTYRMPSYGGAKTVIINGTENAILDNTWGSYLENSTLTFNNVNFKVGTGKANGNGSDYAALYSKNVTYNNCTFSGPMRVGRDGAKFNGCTFNDLGNDYIWNYGNAVEFVDCTFNTEGKAILLYSDGNGVVPAVKVVDCMFNSTKGAKAGAIKNQNCAAIEIDNYGCGVDLTISGNTIDSNFSGIWRIKTYYTGKEAVKVGGVEYTTIAIDGKTMTIDANKNVTVND